MPHRRRRRIEWEFWPHQYDRLVQRRIEPLFPSEKKNVSKIKVKQSKCRIWRVKKTPRRKLKVVESLTIRRALGLAPWSSNSVTHSAWPPAAAKINGVVESYKDTNQFNTNCIDLKAMNKQANRKETVLMRVLHGFLFESVNQRRREETETNSTEFHSSTIF